MKSQPRIKYHPNADHAKDSVVLKEALRLQLEGLQKLLEPSLRAKKLLQQIEKAYQPTKSYERVLEKLSKAMEPTARHKRLLEQMEKAYQPSKEFERVLEKR